MRRVCIAIGVSRAEGLSPLRAAATAAEEIGQWAALSGFAKREDIRVLTDRENPVTIELIAETLETLLPIGTQTDTLLLHFAGHGLREDSTRTLWLPTNWRTKLRAIAVERLKNRLSDFGIANVTIISDACKALASDKDTSDLTPDGILGTGTSSGKRPIFDRFDAVHDVESAFMIPGSTPAESRCLFSGALIEALWGTGSAIDRHYSGKVTPGSLADYLSVRVAELCATYQLSCEPQSLPGRPEDHLIYFDKNIVDAGVIPNLPAWPAPIDTRSTTSANAELDILEKAAFTDEPDSHGASESSAAYGAPSHRELARLKTKPRDESRRSTGASRKARRSDDLGLAYDRLRWPRHSNGNVRFAGDVGMAVWSNAPVHHVRENQWRAEIEGGSQQLVVEYGNGVFLPLLVYPDYITIVARDTPGPNGWLLRGEYEEDSVFLRAVDILDRLQSGRLRPTEVDRVAAVLRRSKHRNPVLGAICAYLYDYAGDIDNIRRMAYFYADGGQSIPYDIALMGELLTHNGSFMATVDVPRVERRARNQGGRLPGFVTDETPPAAGPVGGRCPWLRQGWDFVETPTDREAALVEDLPDIRKHLLPETFTSFNREGGEILTRHWGMERWR